MKLIHISDTHINGAPVLGSDPVVNFDTCMAHVDKHHSDADMVIITGDLTHHGQRSSYIKLRDLMADRKTSPLLVLGNHDHRALFLEIFPQYRPDENGFIQYVITRPEGHFIILDTVKAGTHAGHYCALRQAWLKQQLQTARDAGQPAFLFMHHHPVDVGVKSSDSIGLMDGPAFRDILKDNRDVIRHIFFGHCHYILSGSVCGIPFSSPRSTNHPCVPVFTGTSRLGFAPYPPTYNVCLIREESVIVHSIDFRDDDKVTWMETTSSGWIDEQIPEDA